MTVTRRDVFERLAEMSDPDTGETTTVGALAAELETDEGTVLAHLRGLFACDLARRTADAGVRVTITGEELLNLDIDETAIVETPEET